MKLEGRRSSRNLPKSLSNGTVVSAPANGDCFFHLVSLGIQGVVLNERNEKTEESSPSPKRKKTNKDIVGHDSDSEIHDSSFNISNYVSVSSLRNLVADKYSKETFELMIIAGQIPCTSRTVPSFNEYASKLRNERAFADEHCLGIISSHLDIAFLILDDNIGGKPVCYWNASEIVIKDKDTQSQSSVPKYFMTLRLGRQHYSGIQFDNKLLHHSKHLHPQIAKFWETQIKNIQ